MTMLNVEVRGQVAVLEMNRPPANFFDHDILHAITTAISELAADGCRAVVLAAAGKHFCAGANFGEGAMGDERVASSSRLYRQAVRLFRAEIPVVAAVQGRAVGGGLGLACAADFRVASPGSRFLANFAALGFHQGFGLSVSLPQIVGHQRAAELLYTARRVTGAEAHAIGLVDRLAEDGDIRAAALAFAEEIAAQAPLAVASIRETLRGPLAEQVESVRERELAEQARLWRTGDSAEGIAASLERRAPVFRGR
ncbi:enoyl-CoA hydratase/carnithine racemase [Pseudonocardia kunmingensis]|uniref:Enoyl-CoA hydratase/carnithine racemase n=2 Tax=Pseudonocardia kunmingensis TaxID=630975 RepID=A0A543D0E8_9PSEU|nr:enoyl-CoA hydratase/carnithine racemase [Pseudonocardia kunmingensis]